MSTWTRPKAERCCHLELADLVPLADVDWYGENIVRGRQGSNSRCRGVQALAVEVGKNDLQTHRRKPLGGSEADPRCGAGDDRNMGR
jgi:hypothetical protein